MGRSASDSDRLWAVERAVRRALQAAGAYARAAFRARDYRVERKPDGTPVTTADLRVQRIVREVWAESFPDVPVVGEEPDAGSAAAETDAYLLVDPIDGTTNFLRGVPFFACAAAYVQGGEVVVGVVYDPLHDDRFVAVRGAGAWWNDRPAVPERVDDPGRAEVCLPVDTLPRSLREAALARVVPAVWKVRAARSAALELCGVACGRFSAAVHGRLAAWDAAAALLFVEEAGAVWSPLDGTVGWTRGRRFSVLSAATPALHAALAERLGPVRDAVAVAVRPEGDASAVLAVRRPDDDPDLPGIWGLPAASLRPGESWAEAVERVGRQKLGVAFRDVRLRRDGAAPRGGGILRMRLYEARVAEGEPRVPQPVGGVTQYAAARWAEPGALADGARRGSLCCRLALDAFGLSPDPRGEGGDGGGARP